MARKNGVLTQINELWLNSAPKDAKREVRQRVNEIKAVVTARVEALRPKKSSVLVTRGSLHDAQRGYVIVMLILPASLVVQTVAAMLRPLGAEQPVIETRNTII